eukprot:14509893-Heterocapsa_arctica.AAC.1
MPYRMTYAEALTQEPTTAPDLPNTAGCRRLIDNKHRRPSCRQLCGDSPQLIGDHGNVIDGMINEA